VLIAIGGRRVDEAIAVGERRLDRGDGLCRRTLKHAEP
jgi:hypothetical protein